jgi:hypothetical protein
LASGDIVISGLTGPVRTSSASGQITLTDLSGAVTAERLRQPAADQPGR